MSGIAAIVYCDGRAADRADIDRVVRSLRSYGPEKQAVKLVGPVAFAYAHFTDTPEARGAMQPVTGGDGRFTMVLDGRLDNRDELAAALNMDRDRLVVTSDVQLAMACWERWGADSMLRWVGEFSVIVWDATEQYLTAARDHFGARTLHYNADGNRVVIASAPKCIHAIGDLPRRVDRQKVADSLSQLYHDSERTFFEGIKRIAPASLITVAGSAVKSRKYYSFRENVKPVRYATDDEYVEAGLELLDQSVKAQLRTARPVGAFMSGGLDSSAMSALAARDLQTRGKSLITFTSVPVKEWDKRNIRGLFGDESPYVRDIGAHVPGLEINFVDGAGIGHYYRQEELLLHLEMPVRNALNLQWTHAILEQAQKRDVGVMLQGVFGNATLTHDGDGVFAELLKQGSLRQLYKELAAMGKGPRRMFKSVFRHLVFPMGPNWLWMAKERLRGRENTDRVWERAGAVTKEFAEEMNIPQRVKDAGYGFHGSKPQLSRALWYNMIENFVTDTGDIIQGLRAMYGIDIRDPFADRRVVEWSFGPPETQFHRLGVNRWLIRRMMKGLLPDSVIDNRKIGHQTADWHARLSRDLPAIRRDLDVMAQDPDLSAMIDVDKLRNLIDNWPTQSIVDLKDERFVQLQLNLPMVLQIGRFVQREKGTNTL